MNFSHTSYALGFKVSKELLVDDMYKRWNMLPFLHKAHKKIMKMVTDPRPLWRLRKHHDPVDDWPPSPDDLNERWWE